MIAHDTRSGLLVVTVTVIIRVVATPARPFTASFSFVRSVAVAVSVSITAAVAIPFTGGACIAMAFLELSLVLSVACISLTFAFSLARRTAISVSMVGLSWLGLLAGLTRLGTLFLVRRRLVLAVAVTIEPSSALSVAFAWFFLEAHRFRRRFGGRQNFLGCLTSVLLLEYRWRDSGRDGTSVCVGPILQIDTSRRKRSARVQGITIDARINTTTTIK